MKSLVGQRHVSVILVLCMIAATISLMLAANPAKGMAYQQPFAFMDGEQQRESFARSMALMDLNGDGISDLAVGAPYATINTMKDAGSVRVYLSSGGIPLSKVIYINGTHGSDLFGFAVANVGDVNGDGKDDLAVGAPYADLGTTIDAGNVTLFYGWSGFSGKANVSINSANDGEGFGYALSAAGDIDGDGMDDMIVGAPYYSSATVSEMGRAYIFYGGSPMDGIADMTFTGDVAYGHFGWSVSGNANIDNDASMDMVVGAPDEVSAGVARGAAHIFRNLDRASPQSSVVRGAAANDKFGFCVMMINDINGDTYDDIAIGAPYNDDNGTDAGEVSILYGGARFNEQVDLTLMGQAPNEWFGFSIASGDFRQDTYCDLIVGAPNSSMNATSSGRAYGFYGGDPPSAYPSVIFVPEPGSNFLGGSAAVGGNMSGDAAPDFAVGDPQFNVPGLPNAGRAYVYTGVLIVTPTNPRVWGYVYSSTSVGLQGFTITLKSQSTTFSKSTTTTANGSYGVSPLEITAVPGTYWLNATKAGYVLNTTTVTLVMDQVKKQDFYPDTVPIVTGVVTEVPATAIWGATVAMYNGTTFVQSAVTPVNGTYWMPLPTAFIPAAGNQTNLTIKAWDGTHYLNWKNVTVRRSDTKVADIQLDRFPHVTGVVRDAISSSAVRNAVIIADQGGVVLGTDTSDLRGSYDLIAVNATAPGPLYLNVTAPGYWKDSATVAVARNAESTQDFFLQSDTTPPTSSITTTLQSYTNTTSITLDATADDLQGIQEVQLWYRHGGSGSYSEHGADQTSPYSFAFNTGTTGGDGLYEFYTIAVDVAANVEAAPVANDTWTFVDTHAPVLTITAPTEGQIFGTSTVAVTWTGSDAGSGIQGYRVQLDTGAWVAKGLATSHSFTSVADGSHKINVMVSDKALLETMKIVNVTVDTTNAASQVNALPAYTTVANFVVTATASDPTGIQEVQLWYRFNGSGAFVYFGRDTTSPYTYQFNTPSIRGEGLYEFYSRAIDGAGNNESAPAGNDTWTIVDTVKPVATLSSLPTFTTTGIVTLGATASDADGIYEVQLWYRYDETGSFEYFGADLTQPYSFSFDTSLMSGDGLYEFYVLAVDDAGNNKTTPVGNETWTIVDTVRPVVSLNSLPAHTATVDFTVTATASDANGVADVSLYVSKNGSAYTLASKLTVAPYSWTIQSGEGAFDFYALATDKAGNTRNVPTSPDATTYVDTSAPALRIVSPANNTLTAETTVVVTWNGSDSGSGIQMYKIQIDSGAWMNLGFNTSHTFSGLLSGSHKVTINATDNVSKTTIESVVFVVDNVPPSVTISSPILGSVLKTADVTVTWTATDTHSGVDRVEVAIDGGAFEEVGNATSATFQGLENGEHNVTVRVWDRVGNHEDATIGFEVKVKGDTGNTTAILAGVGILALVVVVALAILLMRKRGAKPPEEGPKGKVEEKSG